MEESQDEVLSCEPAPAAGVRLQWLCSEAWARCRCEGWGSVWGLLDVVPPTVLVLLQVKESMAEGEPGHTSKARSVSTAARWFQSKRVPLYFMVGAGEAARDLYSCLEDVWQGTHLWELALVRGYRRTTCRDAGGALQSLPMHW